MLRIGVILGLCLLASTAVAGKPNLTPADKAAAAADYDAAIAEWKTGYSITGEPAFLYNIAQAYRQKKDFELALSFYRSYLRDYPDAPNRSQVLEITASLEKALREGNPEQPTTTPASIPASLPAIPPASLPTSPPASAPASAPVTAPGTAPTPSPDHGRGLRWAGVGVGGAGLVLVATGVVFALRASSIESDVEAAATRHESWSSWSSKNSDGESAGTMAVVGISVGVAALAVGGALYLLGRSKGKPEAVSVVPAIGPGGGQLTVQVEF